MKLCIDNICEKEGIIPKGDCDKCDNYMEIERCSWSYIQHHSIPQCDQCGGYDVNCKYYIIEDKDKFVKLMDKR